MCLNIRCHCISSCFLVCQSQFLSILFLHVRVGILTIFMVIIDSIVNIMQAGPIVLLTISFSRLLRGSFNDWVFRLLTLIMTCVSDFLICPLRSEGIWPSYLRMTILFTIRSVNNPSRKPLALQISRWFP
jgi:hypothetical protein